MAEASGYIDQCFAELEKVAQAIQKQQWDHARQSVQAYQQMVEGLQQFPPEQLPADRLKQLDVLHRRYVRLLSQRMYGIQSSMNTVEQGLGRLKKSSEILEQLKR